jgi:hypothetical protein
MVPLMTPLTGRVQKVVARMRRAPSDIHLVFATPWRGDPRVNIQDHQGAAKPYQVRQVLRAIEKLEGEL